MAVVAGVDPVRIGAVAFMLTRSRPMRLLIGHFIGGFGLSLIIGVVVVFVLKDLKIAKTSAIPPGIEIAVGALALLVAPDATRTRIEQLYAWVSSHQRMVVTVLAGVVGTYLVIVGVSKI